MNTSKKIFKQWRVWVLLLALFFSALAINYQFDAQGVVINSVETNSSAALAGIQNPSSDVKPTARERILRIDRTEITDVTSYTEAVERIALGSTFRIQTDQAEYALLRTNDSVVGIEVGEVPSSNLRKGLDLQGGTRVVLRPEGITSDADVQDLIDVMERRLNVYGLTDLSIKAAEDLEGNKFIVVEIAGATKEEVRELVASQGVFEAKIGEDVVFEGGKKDVTFVCRKDGTCSGVSRCGETAGGGAACRFEFEIALSDAAAQRHADITKELAVNTTENGQRVLEKTIDFYLDGMQVDSLQIAADLKGQKATRILISGPGSGATQSDAVTDAVQNMNKLQTVLISGSLPTEIEIEKLDSISPSLGEAFVKNTLWVSLFAIIAVAVVMLIRYRALKIVGPAVITVLSEIFIVLGLAALFRYNLDLAAIAGIIAAVGTGIDDQIVITDEILFGSSYEGSLKRKIKTAFFVIFAAFATTVAAMIPLLRAGAGLLTGFALVTIAGVTVGVLITRPAFAAIIRVLLEK